MGASSSRLSFDRILDEADLWVENTTNSLASKFARDNPKTQKQKRRTSKQPDPVHSAPHSTRPRTSSFNVKSVRRISKIEDEDNAWHEEFGFFASGRNSMDLDALASSRMSIRSNASCSSLPRAARGHRKSWSTSDDPWLSGDPMRQRSNSNLPIFDTHASDHQAPLSFLHREPSQEELGRFLRPARHSYQVPGPSDSASDAAKKITLQHADEPVTPRRSRPRIASAPITPVRSPTPLDFGRGGTAAANRPRPVGAVRFDDSPPLSPPPLTPSRTRSSTPDWSREPVSPPQSPLRANPPIKLRRTMRGEDDRYPSRSSSRPQTQAESRQPQGKDQSRSKTQRSLSTEGLRSILRRSATPEHPAKQKVIAELPVPLPPMKTTVDWSLKLWADLPDWPSEPASQRLHSSAVDPSDWRSELERW